MKNLILALIATTALNASAFSTMGGSSEFTRIQVQKGSHLEGQNIASGAVRVDLRGRGYLTVELQPAFFCPANMMCAQVMLETLKYAVAIQKIEIGNCQETIYSGVQDDSISDGLKIGITVIDNSTNTCPTFVALEGTEVTLTIQGGFLPINEEHRFGGQLLK